MCLSNRHARTCINLICFEGCNIAKIVSRLRLYAVSLAVLPRLSFWCSSAPAVRSTRTTSSWPRLHANIRAVLPCAVCRHDRGKTWQGKARQARKGKERRGAMILKRTSQWFTGSPSYATSTPCRHIQPRRVCSSNNNIERSKINQRTAP